MTRGDTHYVVTRSRPYQKAETAGSESPPYQREKAARGAVLS